MIVGHLGHWEGDLIIGAHGTSAAATLVERTTRFVTILALPVGEGTPEGLCDVFGRSHQHHPRCDAGFLDLGSRLRKMHLSCRAHPGYRHEDVFSSRPRSPWERGTNENTGGLNL